MGNKLTIERLFIKDVERVAKDLMHKNAIMKITLSEEDGTANIEIETNTCIQVFASATFGREYSIYHICIGDEASVWLKSSHFDTIILR